MKRAYDEFFSLAAFEPCEYARGAVVKQGNEVGEANEAMDFLPIYSANPFAIEFL